MKKRIARVAAGIVCALILSFSFAAPVFAIDPPDDGPFILQVDMYRHVLEDDDILVHGRYNWPYAAAPSETITQAVFARLLNGATEVARSSIYAYYNRGWGYGSFAMYLNASEASGLWEAALTVETRGSPTLDWGGDAPVASTSVLNWRSTSSTTATQSLMYAHFISWANTLGDYWSVSLTGQYAGETKLSSYGEAYFTNVVEGLRVMCPQLFSSTLEVPDYEDIVYPTTGAEEMSDNWPFDFGGLSEYFGMPSSDEILRTVIAFIIIFTVCAVMVGRGIPTSYALFGGFALMFVLAVPGFISLILVGAIVFVVVVMAGLVFLVRRN